MKNGAKNVGILFIRSSVTDRIRENNEPDGADLDGCAEIILSSIKTTALWHDTPCLAKDTKQFICEVEAQRYNSGMTWPYYNNFILCSVLRHNLTLFKIKKSEPNGLHATGIPGYSRAYISQKFFHYSRVFCTTCHRVISQYVYVENSRLHTAVN